MSSLPVGLYDQLVTELLQERLAASGDAGHARIDPLRTAEAADRLALHIASLVERAVEALPESRRVREGTALARRLVDELERTAGDEALRGERPAEPARRLHAVRGTRPDGQAADIPEPLIPLLDTTLLTNAPGEPNLGHRDRNFDLGRSNIRRDHRPHEHRLACGGVPVDVFVRLEGRGNGGHRGGSDAGGGQSVAPAGRPPTPTVPAWWRGVRAELR